MPPTTVSSSTTPYTILLFYIYTPLARPEEVRDWQRELCTRLGLMGRVIVAGEGLNVTLEGTAAYIALYINEMKADKRFADFSTVDFKTSPGTGKAFPRLSVKVRPEIVALKANPTARGTHLAPETLHKWMEEGKKDLVIIDMRNDYEYASGRFAGSVAAPIHRFRELPQKVEEGAFDQYKDKVVVPVCTGGVRCEKASGLLVERGFKEVYQLSGGMHRYLEQYPQGHFKGALYVFDGRVATHFDGTNTPVVGRCVRCTQPSEDYTNCEELSCHTHIILCAQCREGGIFCSEGCKARIMEAR